MKSSEPASNPTPQKTEAAEGASNPKSSSPIQAESNAAGARDDALDEAVLALKALRGQATIPTDLKERREWTGKIWADYIYHVCDGALKKIATLSQVPKAATPSSAASVPGEAAGDAL